MNQNVPKIEKHESLTVTLMAAAALQNRKADEPVRSGIDMGECRSQYALAALERFQEQLLHGEI